MLKLKIIFGFVGIFFSSLSLSAPGDFIAKFAIHIGKYNLHRGVYTNLIQGMDIAVQGGKAVRLSAEQLPRTSRYYNPKLFTPSKIDKDPLSELLSYRCPDALKLYSFVLATNEAKGSLTVLACVSDKFKSGLELSKGSDKTIFFNFIKNAYHKMISNQEHWVLAEITRP